MASHIRDRIQNKIIHRDETDKIINDNLSLHYLDSKNQGTFVLYERLV